MVNLSNKRRKSKKQLILQYTKPFTKRVLPLGATNDKRYIPSGRSSSLYENCNHEYCLAQRTRQFVGSKDRPIKPVGLPWASGCLKYLPGHVKVIFPLRKKQPTPAPPKRSVTPPSVAIEQTEIDDKITDPEMCGVIDEILYAYKVFMLAGMIISEAKATTEENDKEGDDEDLE